MFWLQAVLIVLVLGPVNSSVSVISCHHFYEYYLFRRPQNLYFVFFSIRVIMIRCWLRKAASCDEVLPTPLRKLGTNFSLIL
jgi:hypothetical protein